MTHKITQEKAQILKDNFFEFSFTEKEPNKQLFDTLTNPAELHFIADIYNWDDGTEVLTWIINSPICDQGTAKLIFWRSQPDYYTKFMSKEEATWAGDVYLLLRNIIENFEKSFYKSENISYNPRQDSGAPSDIDERDPNEKWAIPEFMKTPTKGQ